MGREVVAVVGVSSELNGRLLSPTSKGSKEPCFDSKVTPDPSIQSCLREFFVESDDIGSAQE